MEKMISDYFLRKLGDKVKIEVRIEKQHFRNFEIVSITIDEFKDGFIINADLTFYNFIKNLEFIYYRYYESLKTVEYEVPIAPIKHITQKLTNEEISEFIDYILKNYE